MSLWLAIGGLTLAAVVPILWPLLRPSRRVTSRLEHDVEVYRDQLREVDVELAAGAVTAKEAAEARREIERRILRAAEQGQGRDGSLTPSALTAVMIALLMPALTLFLYVWLGQPGQPDQPLVARKATASAPASAASSPELSGPQRDQINEMVASLAKRLQEQPDDLDGWILLGRSQAALARYDAAAKALRRALAISRDDAKLQMALGDVLTKGAGGRVTPEAMAAFKKAQELEPGHLAARYYLALAELQAGRPQAAYDTWLALYRELPETDENRPALAAQIGRVAEKLGLEPARDLAVAGTPARPAPAMAPGPDRAAMAAAANMSTGDREKFIQSMVQRLADRLQDEPDDFDGWMRLAKAYGVLQRPADAADAYGRAAALRPTDAVPLDAQATALIDGAASDQALPQSTLAVLRKLEILQPDNPRALWFLGMVDAGEGRRSAALARWKRLHDQLPANSKEREKLQAAIDQLQAAR
ncbi:MAG: c-type cytochrome biogenesis protein CcmI [Proteobacteria bacterium]|nr:c-type cytochrome biogenesis protein CcmI [Pseudomonadota bacterium]